MTRIALLLIRGYQLSLGPALTAALGPSCRFEPSCSKYTYEAVARYGWRRGGWIGLKRLLRCNPLSRGGFDPVP